MKRTNVKDAVWAGIIASFIFLMLEMIMVPLFLEGSPWAPPRMMSAIVLGQEVVPPPAGFELGMFITAIIINLILSVVYTLVIAAVIHRLSLPIALVIGAIAGYVIYLANFYAFTEVFPWFANARNWVTVFAHISFGIAAAWSYKGLLTQLQKQKVGEEEYA